VHEGLAAFYEEKDPLPIADAVVDEVLKKEEMLQEEKEMLESQKEVVHQLVTAYVNLAKEDNFKVLAPEVRGSAPLNDKHRLFFTTDAVVSCKGALWLMEHKTTSYTGVVFFKKFRMDMQISAYVYAVWRALGTRPVGVILNVLSKKKGTIERDIITRSAAQLEEFVYTACKLCDQIEQTPPKKEEWLCSTGNCVAFNRVCEYLDLCTHDSPGVRESYAKREADYVDIGRFGDD